MDDQRKKREKFLYLPQAHNYTEEIAGGELRVASAPIPEPDPGPEPPPGEYPCPCCGYKTFPVPKEEAISYICPVCFWENDLFGPGAEYPSDENHGMTLSQGREMYQRVGAVREDLLPYVRKPLPEEMPE